MLQIGILGPGAVGGYFGAKLARTYAGSDKVKVIFLARENTAGTLRNHGIKLITPREEFIAHAHAISTDGKDVGPVDYLLCAVKSYDLEESLRQFASCIGPNTIILPLLNGIDAMGRAKKMFPGNEVWNGCVYIVSRIAQPGVIRATGNIHALHFGSTGTEPLRPVRLKSVLLAAHEEIYLHPDIDAVTWEKFVFISSLASLTSYLDVCIGKILKHTASRKLLMQLLEEIVCVASAEKILLREDIIPATIRKMESLPFETTSSMHSDFQRNGRTEIDSLTTHVVELAQQHGVKVPTYGKVLDGLRMRLS